MVTVITPPFGVRPRTSLALKTWDSVASVSGEGSDEVGLEEGLRCLVLTTFQPGAEGGEELGVCVVAGCDCVQVKGVKVDDNGVLVA